MPHETKMNNREFTISDDCPAKRDRRRLACCPRNSRCLRAGGGGEGVLALYGPAKNVPQTENGREE